jgi:RimJ/RimL family protein N-acetyltransferase
VSAEHVIETARLTLAPYTAADLDGILALYQEPTVLRYLFDGERVEIDVVREHLRASDERFRAGSLGLFVGRFRAGAAGGAADPAALVGFCGMIPLGDAHPLDLVYGLGPAFLHRGLATEMGAAIVAAAFTRLGLDAVDAGIDEPNVASGRVLARLGMTLVGREPGPKWPQVRYRLARADWHA